MTNRPTPKTRRTEKNIEARWRRDEPSAEWHDILLEPGDQWWPIFRKKGVRRWTGSGVVVEVHRRDPEYRT